MNHAKRNPGIPKRPIPQKNAKVVLGSRLKRPLNTASLSTANALKWQIVAELRAIIDRAAQGNPKADQPANEALSIAAHRVTLTDPEAVRELDEEITRRADEMRGDPVETEADGRGGPVYIYDQVREAKATAFADLAMGRATPLGHHHAAYLSHSLTKARTQGDSRRAIAFLTEWCGRVGKLQRWRPSPARRPYASTMHYLHSQALHHPRSP
jgi:hypothetical protein